MANESLKAALFSQRGSQETFPLPAALLLLPTAIRNSGVVPQHENHGSLMV